MPELPAAESAELRTGVSPAVPREKMRVEIRSALEILDRAIRELAEPVPPVRDEDKPYASACEAGFHRATKSIATRDIRCAQDRLEWLSLNLAEEAEGE